MGAGAGAGAANEVSSSAGADPELRNLDSADSTAADSGIGTSAGGANVASGTDSDANAGTGAETGSETGADGASCAATAREKVGRVGVGS